MSAEFEEIQYFPVLVFVLVVGIIFHALLLCRRVPLTLNIAISALSAPMLFLLLQQKTMVDEQAIHIQFGWVPIIQYTVPLKEITASKILTYVRTSDFWGVQGDGASMPPFIAGIDEGLVLQLKDGSHYLVGSRFIKDLQEAIEKGRKKSGDRD